MENNIYPSSENVFSIEKKKSSQPQKTKQMKWGKGKIVTDN